ncbi:Isochorismatase-like protein [Xylogone sp. PMI_703]|nr:Isochorismatase-like protein [Xylogone sp. PMI_703]
MHNDLALPDFSRKRREALARGSKGYALWSELDIREAEGDLLVEKRMFSAFIQGSSDLDSILRQRGIDTLLITGTVTSVCCESTARDAMMRNYRVVMVSDANAAFTDHEHNVALSAFYGTFGDVMPTDMVIECLEKNGKVNGTV